MKKGKFLICLLLSLALTSCNHTCPKISGYSIDEDNNIIIIYDNGNTENVGNITDEDIVDHVTSITISEDGYFVINGIKTSTKVTFSSVEISEDGYYIIDGIKTSIKAGYNSITISSDGYYVVNGVKTNIKVDYSSVTISSDGYYVINGYKTDIKVDFYSVEISDDGYYIINGFKTDIKATNVYTVDFITGYNATVPQQEVFEGHKVERPELDRTGYNLDGWFCNGEEWRFNSDIVLNDMTLKAEWTAKNYTVSFINEKGDNPSNITVTYDAQYTLPNVDSVDGYTFGGWYSGSTKYSGGTWNTDSDVTLTAKWIANRYTVTLDPGVGEVSTTSFNISYNSSYKLPVPTNDYGIFVGWLCDGTLVTDDEGNSLSPWTFTENKTFTVDWEIKLSTAADLEYLHTYPNAAFVLENDIDASSLTEWIPVGDGVSSFFTGHFDGKGYSISNIKVSTVNLSSRNSFGFFGTIDGANISNVHIKDFEFTSENINQSYAVGALFGRSTNINGNSCTINNCKVSGTFSIASQSSSKAVYAGGLAGLVGNSIINSCINEIEISNAHYAGGIVGYDFQSQYSNCLNTAKISATLTAGGIVGYEDTMTTVVKCINYGDITGSDNAGGIIGWGGSGFTGNYCVNTGSITSTTNGTYSGTGGIVGSVYDAYNGVYPYVNLNYCYNRGNISGINSGGLFGYTYNANVKNSYNNSSVSGSDYSGGIGGAALASTAKMTQCLASGSVSGGVRTTLCGPGVGSSSDCYYTYSSTSSFYLLSGTYTSSSNAQGSTLYKESMYWIEYDAASKTGQWVFHDSDYPSLGFEGDIEELSDSWL